MKKILILVSFLAAGFAGCEKNDEPSALFPFFNETGKYGYIDINGNVKIEPQWDGANRFIFDRTIVYQGNKPGMIDKTGNLIIPFDKYSMLGIAEADVSTLFNPKFLVAAMSRNLWGFLDKDGAVKIPLQYQFVSNFLDGMAAVQIDGKFGFINENGTLVIPAIYEGRGWFYEGLCWVGKLTGGVIKWGVINKSGETIIPFNYDNRFVQNPNTLGIRFVNGVSPCFINGIGSGFINPAGEQLFGLTGSEYDWTANYSEHVAAVCKNNLVGFVDEDGNEVIPLLYQNVYDFIGGTAPFRNPSENLWGYLKKNGEVFMVPQFINAYSIKDGLAWVIFQDSTAGYINEQGTTVWRSTVIQGSWNK